LREVTVDDSDPVGVQSPPQPIVRRLEALLRLDEGDRELLISIECAGELRGDLLGAGCDRARHASSISAG
jgi:hypothetical protein